MRFGAPTLVAGLVLVLRGWAAAPSLSSPPASTGPAPAVAAPTGPGPLLLPPLSDEGLPPLPAQSARNASYTIEARLDPDAHRIDGELVLDWRNTSGRPLSSFPFHLYWNAFRNNLSTSARGEGRRSARVGDPARRERGFAYTQVRSVRLE